MTRLRRNPIFKTPDHPVLSRAKERIVEGPAQAPMMEQNMHFGPEGCA